MDLQKITAILRAGVKEIISRASPPCSPEQCGKFQSSVHNSREVLFVISGDSSYLCNHSVYPCRQGTLMLFDSGVTHGFGYPEEDCGLVHLWGFINKHKLYWNLIEVAENGKVLFNPRLRNITIPEFLREMLDYRWNQLNKHQNITGELVDEYMRPVMNMVLDELALQISEMPVERPPETVIEEIQVYIQSMSGRKCSLENIAEKFGYTRSHLAHKFRAETGMTIGKFIDQVRLEYVRIALRRGVSQKELAYELGYSSPASFWRWMQKYRNINPKIFSH